MPSNHTCCEWSKYNGGCGTPCDFKNLKYDKDAIIERLREEARWTQSCKETIARGISREEGEKMMVELADKIVGMQIMSTRLTKDFGIKDEDLRKMLRSEVRHNFVTDAKIALAVAKMKYSRGKKQ